LSIVLTPEARTRGGGLRSTVGEVKALSALSSSENAGEGAPISGDARICRIISLDLMSWWRDGRVGTSGLGLKGVKGMSAGLGGARVARGSV
jgi:hypothetical protein